MYSLWCSLQLLIMVSQLGRGLSDTVDQRTLDDVVLQDVDQRTEKAVAVGNQHHQIAKLAAENAAGGFLATHNNSSIRFTNQGWY